MEEFENVRYGPVHAWVRRDFKGDLQALGLNRAAFEPPRDAGTLKGRGTVFVVDRPSDPDRRIVIRRYRHGGLSGLLFGPWFAGASRALREARLAALAVSRGVPTFKPLAAVTRRSFGVFYRAWLVSEEIPDAADLALLATCLGAGPDDAKKRRAAVRAAARAVRSAHDRGFCHADLNLKNVIVRFDGMAAQAFVIDWDRSTCRSSPLSQKARMANLRRLDRSARKFQSKGVPVPVKERLRFLKHYLSGGGVERPSAAEIRRWSALARVHALAWFVEGG